MAFQCEMEATGLPDAGSTREFARKAIEGHVSRKEAFLLEVGVFVYLERPRFQHNSDWRRLDNA